MSSELENAVSAVVVKFRAIATEYKQNTDAIMTLQQRQAELERQAQDCYAAARLFNFDLAVERLSRRSQRA